MLIALKAAGNPALMFVTKKSMPLKKALITADFQFQPWTRVSTGCRTRSDSTLPTVMVLFCSVLISSIGLSKIHHGMHKNYPRHKVPPPPSVFLSFCVFCGESFLD